MAMFSRLWCDRFRAGTCALLLLGAVSGCAHQYDITLQNGDMIRAKTKPKLNDQGYYVFKDLNDRDMEVKSMRIRQIEPARRGAKSSDSFFIKDK